MKFCDANQYIINKIIEQSYHLCHARLSHFELTLPSTLNFDDFEWIR